MDEEILSAGDNRSNFLKGKMKEHILYFWHLADKNELLIEECFECNLQLIVGRQ
jgi:hypothetical protein